MAVKPFSKLNYLSKNYNIISAAMIPTYSVSASTTSVNEGSVVTITVTTQYLPDNTTLYWDNTGTTVAADFTDGLNSGAIVVTNNTATIVRTLTSDITIEGSETFIFNLRTGSITGTIVASSPTVTVNDTSVLTITPDVSSCNEGATVTWTISAIGFGTGTLYYTNSGTTNAADFTDGLNSGSIAITADSGTLTKTLINDFSTEGSETIIIQIRTGSTAGIIVGTSNSVTVADTSITSQPYSVQFNGTSQSLAVTNQSALGLGTGDFTIECWANFSSIPENATIVDLRLSGSGASQPKPTLIFTTGNVLWYYVNGVGRISSSALSTGQWYHVAVSKSSNITKLYINGVQQGSNYTDTNDYGASNPCQIGTVGDSPGFAYLGGYISNLRIVKGTAVYTSNFTPPTDNLAAIVNTVLLTCKLATISDSSSNAFTITNTGAAIVSMMNPFGDYSMSFNGSNQYLSIPSNASLALGTGDFTIEYWVYLNSYGPSNYGLFDQRNGTNGGGVVQPLFSVDATNGYYWYVAAGVRISSGTAAVAVQRWQHLAVVRTSGVTRMYINGVQAGSSYTDSNNYPAGSIFLGHANDGVSGTYLNGYMSNVRVVKGTALYSSNFVPSTSALTAITNTQLLTCQYAELLDASVNNLSITNNNATPAATQNPFGNYYASFNGSSQYLTIPSNSNLAMTGDFTIEGWHYFKAAPGTGTSSYNVLDNSASGGIGYNFDTTNATLFASFVANQASFSYTWQTNTWYHVVFVRSGTTINCYVNGTALTPVTGVSYSWAQGGSVTIGKNAGASQNYFNGYISNLRIVKGTTVYTSNFTPPATPLTAITNTALLTCQYVDIVDASINSATITNTGSVTTYPTDIFTGTLNGIKYSQKNYSLSFDGSSQYVTSSATTISNFGSSNFTFECWIYCTNVSVNSVIYDGRATSGNGLNFYVTLREVTNGKLSVCTNGSILYTSTATLSNNTWYHVAVVRSGTGTNQTAVYINGALDGTFTNSTVYVNPFNTIGAASYTAGAAKFPGYISNLRIVNGTAVYSSAFTPSTTPLKPITNTSLLTAQYNTLFDASNNKIALTRVGNADMAPVYPFPA